MSRAGRILLVVPTIAIVGSVGGCGGGKQQVTAAELVQKGDQICRDEQSKFARIQAQPLANASVAADQTKQLIQVSEDASSALGDFEPPQALRSALDAYLSARGRAIDQMKRGQDAAENQDSRGYAAAQAEVAHTAPQRKNLADSLGFKVCSSTPGSV
ncbi:MAG: hypothetical protein QOD14_1097 [Solirubrobacterales bacterium]|jgi:hypothetical protein|nr:hypothetical protein [Solirubrobacterales bacterium]